MEIFFRKKDIFTRKKRKNIFPLSSLQIASFAFEIFFEKKIFVRVKNRKNILPQILTKPGPYPMVVQPEEGGYWVDGADGDGESALPVAPSENSSGKYKLEMDETAKCYRRYFLGKVGRPISYMKSRISKSLIETKKPKNSWAYTVLENLLRTRASFPFTC